MEKSLNRSIYGLRLVRLLSGFTASSAKNSQGNFVEKLGRLVDLHGSIALSKAHGDLSSVAFNPSGVLPGTIREEFLRIHLDLVRSIARSFTPGTGRVRDKLPTPETFHSHCMMTGVYDTAQTVGSKNYSVAFEPYRKFYLARQRNIFTRIQNLRSHVSNAVAGISPELAQLSKLDTALGDILSASSREFFGMAIKLLGRRFGYQLDKHYQQLPAKPASVDLEHWMKPGGWIFNFCAEMRELLFAELEARLQPVLGMIDSLPEGEKFNCD